MSTLTPTPDRPTILVVDDEPDVHDITRISLRSLRHGGRRPKLLSAYSAGEAEGILRERPDIAVVLLDVVMESDHAGLDLCRTLREELDNPFPRILLRTGQPGQAPEKQTIDTFDIDGYLPKAELTSGRLYSAARTALRTWQHLVAIERHRQALAIVHRCATGLRAYDGVETSLQRIVDRAAELVPTALALLSLTVRAPGAPARSFFVHRAADDDALAYAEAKAEFIAVRVRRALEQLDDRRSIDVDGGLMVPVRLHRGLGDGWLYLDGAEADDVIEHALPLLAEHASNALYSSVAQAVLVEDAPLFSQLSL